MNVLNRSLVVLRPKQPFLDWLRGLPDPAMDITLNEMQRDSNRYLLPELYDDGHEDEVLREHFEDMFEAELLAWWCQTSDWPQRRGLAVFKSWFDTEWHSMVVDAVGEAFEVEEYGQAATQCTTV